MISWLIYLMLMGSSAWALKNRPRWTVAIAAFFIPMTQVLPTPFGPLSAPANILLLAMAVAWVRVRREEDPPGPVPLRLLMVLMSLFFIWGFMVRVNLEVMQGMVFNNTLEKAFKELKEVVMGFLGGVLAWRLVNSRYLARLVWWAALCAGGGEALLALYERIQGAGRASAHLDDPNKAGAFFASAGAMFLATLLLVEGRLRWLAVAGFGTCVAAIFAGLSRGAMVALALSSLVLLTLFFMRVREGFSKPALVVMILLVAFNGTLLLPERVMDRFMETVGKGEAGGRFLDENPYWTRDLEIQRMQESGLDQSSDERLDLWKAALIIMSTHPTGIGFNTFSTRVGDFLERYRGMHKAAHNVYLQVGAELGVGALLVMILMVLGVFFRLAGSLARAEDTEQRIYALGLAGGWLSLVVAVVFITSFFSFNLTGQFWVLFGAGMRALGMRQDDEGAPLELWDRHPLPGAPPPPAPDPWLPGPPGRSPGRAGGS